MLTGSASPSGESIAAWASGTRDGPGHGDLGPDAGARLRWPHLRSCRQRRSDLTGRGSLGAGGAASLQPSMNILSGQSISDLRMSTNRGDSAGHWRSGGCSRHWWSGSWSSFHPRSCTLWWQRVHKSTRFDRSVTPWSATLGQVGEVARSMRFTPRHRRPTAHTTPIAYHQRPTLGWSDRAGGATGVQNLGGAVGEHPGHTRITRQPPRGLPADRAQAVQPRRIRALLQQQGGQVDDNGDMGTHPARLRQLPPVQAAAGQLDERVRAALLSRAVIALAGRGGQRRERGEHRLASDLVQADLEHPAVIGGAVIGGASDVEPAGPPRPFLTATRLSGATAWA